MEKLRPTRSKLPSGSERRSSGERFASKERASSRGNRLVQKQKKLGSDSSSCSSGSTGEDPLTFELGWRSSKQAGGAPIKKLLAEEMLRETESRRRSPSVIAKLMGLDGMPPQQPIAHKQQKGIPENRHQRTRSAEKEHRSGVCYDHRSSRKNSKEQQEFKDVFEVLETSKVESCSYSSRAAANTKLSDAEMAFVRQKFMDAKRLSTDEKLQDSKEFHDALEVLDSNKDLLLKFLQQPDSLFTKHLHDLHSGPQSHCGRVASMKSSEAQKYEKIDLGWTSARESPLRNYCKSPQRHRDSFSSYSDSRHATRYSLKSQYRPEAKHETAITPTRIVVLKPNLGKILNATKTISSPCSSQASMSVCRNRSDFPNIGNREVDAWGKKNFPDNEGQSRHKSRESREVAKEITRQMRKNISMGSVQISSSGFKGYAGDDSSCSMSENESGNESEVISVASKQFSDRHNHSRRSSTCSAESSVSREAKKRLSERWKMTHKSQEIGVASRGNTLAEMLAIPDKEMQAAKLDAMKGEAGFRDKFAREDGPVGWGGPLGISSRDGWKDECIKSLSRSKSLPASSGAFGSYKTMRRETIRDNRYLIPSEVLKHKRNQSVEVDFDHRESGRINYRSRNKRSYSSRSLSRESMDISPETPNTPDRVRTDPVDKQSQQNMAVVESSSGNDIDASPASVKLVDLDVSISSETLDAFPPELSARMSVEGDSCSSHQVIAEESSTKPSDDKSVLFEHSVPGIESLASSKEADQPSPVSVLEVPFNDDVSSSSDCFETLSADLQGLRMQLQLLKLESDSYAEGSMLISSDEDAGEGSSWFRHAVCREEESWESSYMADMLTESGLNNADHETFLATWHATECPVSPQLFEELEKKYCDKTSCPKSERKLLFDRINSGLLEMFQQFSDPHPWVRPMKITVGSKWINRTALQDGLRKLLAGEEKANEESLDKLLERDSLWLHFGDYIDIIGREIERSVLDDLIAEVVVM
ncbi:PREDICTED: uncharacterized protein LOC101298051 [Fragaria vesca subsp. vesca]|uniref:uncharacterized protein LOC101298051 n=1 Tax=Fragaria vesca subsp. vesca TaxID=101020 RepID=UPI0002C32F05|nr:PREDICTED: uncharacterized protein LOC101298051 [Fragaria vesca subsp. vesca]